MRPTLRAIVAVGLYAAAGGAIAVFVAITACSSKLVVLPAKQCENPCCDGPASGIDCAENPNLSCVEDADPCTARTYGCSDGVLFVMGPTEVPTSCSVDGSADDVSVGFVFGGADGSAADGADSGGSAPDGSATDGPGSDASEVGFGGFDGSVGDVSLELGSD